jgi:opacity protein-like surface antigen
MHKFVLILSCLSILAVPAFAAADTVEDGRFTVGARGDWWTLTSGLDEAHSAVWGVEGRVGYFLFDGFELYARGFYGAAEGAEDFWEDAEPESFELAGSAINLGLGLRYHLALGSLVPFAEADVGWLFWQADEFSMMFGWTQHGSNGAAVGIGLGAQFFIIDELAVELGGRYTHAFGLDAPSWTLIDDGQGGTTAALEYDEEDVGLFKVGLGVNWYL